MNLGALDWIIVGAFLAISVWIGFYFSKKAGKSVDDFFVAGRALPWWLAGMTMVASAFAIDTPLGITGLVAKHGIVGVWYAWSFVIGGAGTLGAFIFASMLRRSEVITTAELVELRYSGKAAAGLRLFKGVYFGIIANAVTLGWIIKAVWTVVDVVLGWNPHITLGVVLVFTLFYTAASGMWGIAATDFIQFFIGIIGLIVLYIFSVNEVGGMGDLMARLAGRYGEAEAQERLRFLPLPGSGFFETFLIFVLFKWWSNPPPAIHQRIVASKTEKDASLATMIFAVMQFAVNYWPMIVIALVSLVVFPELGKGEAERGYPMLIVKLIPTGLLGLMLASMLAAFMSTVDTHINYGASYMINDIYRRFINRKGTKKHYVRASRIATLIMLGIAVLVAYSLDSVSQAWYFLAMLTAGYGFLIVARWFWWRINAWSEISALAASGLTNLVLSTKFAKLLGYAESLKGLAWSTKFFIVLGVSTAAWVLVTIFTKPSDEKHLVKFCKKVKPFPTFWGPIYKKHPKLGWNPHFKRSVLAWIFGTLGLYAICFGMGHIFFMETLVGVVGVLLGAGVLAATYYSVYGRQTAR